MKVNDKIYNELQNVIIENCTVCYMPSIEKDLTYFENLYFIRVCEKCVINAVIKVLSNGEYI